MNSMTCDCDIFKTNRAEMKSFSTKCVCVPSSTCFSHQQSCRAGAGFLFTQQQFPAPAPSGQKAGGSPSSPALWPVHSPFLWKTEGFTLDLSSLSSSSKAVAGHERPFCDASRLLFSPFLIQSKVLIVTLLTMDFPRFRSALNFVFLCNQQCSSQKADRLWPLCE